jgi:hypothetical protein
MTDQTIHTHTFNADKQLLSSSLRQETDGDGVEGNRFTSIDTTYIEWRSRNRVVGFGFINSVEDEAVVTVQCRRYEGPQALELAGLGEFIGRIGADDTSDWFDRDD